MFHRLLAVLAGGLLLAAANAQEPLPEAPAEGPIEFLPPSAYLYANPLDAPAFAPEAFSFAPLFSLRKEDGPDLLPRPANPKDILRRDPVVVMESMARGDFVAEEERAWVLQVQGTEVAIDFDVQANLDTTYDTGYTGKISFAPSDIALDGTKEAHSRGNYQMSARTTVLGLDVQAPEAEVPAQAFGEFDFVEPDATFREENDVRLRHSFVRVGGREIHVIGGQQWTLFGDQDARPISLVSGQAPAGAIVSAPLQLRLTGNFGNGLEAAVAVEEPINTDFFAITPDTDTRLQRVPNFVARLRYDSIENVSFVQLAMLMRGLGIEDIAGREHVELGWGASLIAVRPVFELDTLQLGVVTGEGIGDHLYGISGLSVAGGPENGELRAFKNTGFYAGYIHRWSDRVLSHAAYGWAFADTSGEVPAHAAKRLQNGWVNVIWQASDQVALAIEYDYGLREVRDGTSGENHRVQFTISTAPQQSRSNVSTFGRL